MDHCDTCHYLYTDVTAHEVPPRLAAFATRYRELLLPPNPPRGWDTRLRTRPAPDVWSALEYACHIRDVFLVQRDRLYVALVEEKPSFSPMYRDERVVLARYNAQAPEEVAEQIATAARLIAQAFSVLDSAQFARLCVYNYPVPAEHSLLWVGQHVIHEGEHHCHDVAAVLARVQASV